jgi:hypothetical protein
LQTVKQLSDLQETTNKQKLQFNDFKNQNCSTE